MPAGTYTRGSTTHELAWLRSRYRGMSADWFRHEVGAETVWVDAVDVCRVPVTNSQYRLFVSANGYGDERWWSPGGRRWLSTVRRRRPMFWEDPRWEEWARDEHPVVGVTWWEADAYARWAGMRLPTEVEWEKAARGTDERRFPWGEEFRQGLCNSADYWLGREITDLADWLESFNGARPWQSRCLTTPVGSFPEGASPYGILDMAGNIWEWCADDYRLYAGSPYARNGDGVPPGDKVCRGGSFGYFGFSLRAAERGHHPPWWCSLGIGIRCVRDKGGGH